MNDRRKIHQFGKPQYPAELLEAFDFIRSGKIGDPGPFEPLIRAVFEDKDYCKLTALALVSPKRSSS